MANTIVFSYPEISAAAATLKDVATKYEEAATQLQTAMQAATAPWSGASKDKFMELFDTSVMTYAKTSMPGMVNGLATMLEYNLTTMRDADQALADQLITS